MYLLPATPPTVLGQSFSNFTGAFTMVWRYAYCFFTILKLFFITFFCIFNLDFYRALILQKCIGSMYLVHATPPTVSGRSFWNFTQAFRMVWRYAYCFFQNPEIIFYHFIAAGLGGSVGCASDWRPGGWVRPPPRSATFFRGDWSWNIF